MLFPRWPTCVTTRDCTAVRQRGDELVGWVASRKYNGAFARWQGGRLYSKAGRVLQPPSDMVESLPPHVNLELEIYHPTYQYVRYALNHRWMPRTELVVFDLYELNTPFAERRRTLESLSWGPRVRLVRFKTVKSVHHLKSLLRHARTQQHEGLVLRSPKGHYEPGKRSKHTLKWKPRDTTTASVVHVAPKKTGCTLTLRENPKSAVFRVFVRSRDVRWGAGQTVSVAFVGRDPNGKPEFPTVVTPEVKTKSRPA